MKKIFESPTLEVEVFATEDIICVSSWTDDEDKDVGITWDGDKDSWTD